MTAAVSQSIGLQRKLLLLSKQVSKRAILEALTFRKELTLQQLLLDQNFMLL